MRRFLNRLKKMNIFILLAHFEALNATIFRSVLHMSFIIQKYRVSAFTGTKN